MKATAVQHSAPMTVAIGARCRSQDSTLPSQEELEQLFLQKYGHPTQTGWSPRRRHQFGYYLPSDHYEALVAKLVFPGCRWLDVGGGRNIFPHNVRLGRSLSARCSAVVAVDPSNNVHANGCVRERVQARIEDYETHRTFDLATMRMVAEHVAEPDRAIGALSRLLRPGGLAVIFTVNRLAPLTMVSRALPFRLHHPIKSLFWDGAEDDTFPVQYKMNSRKVLDRLFAAQGFNEVAFAYLDDLSALGEFRWGSYFELRTWQLLKQVGLRYPENCLLGVYQKSRAS